VTDDLKDGYDSSSCGTCGLNANWSLKTSNGEGVSNAGSARIGELPD